MKKRTYTIIVCADCGGPAKRANKVTKYCVTCRLGRGAGWQDGRTVTCDCGRDYIAWNGPKAQRMCGACFILRAPLGGREAVPGTCNLCHQATVLYSKHLACCYPCLDDPANYVQVKQSITQQYNSLLQKKQLQSQTS